ncbi:MAG: hypothetical protein QXZ43_02705 [Candidatus Aenigmatarchaeota archaeon]
MKGSTSVIITIIFSVLIIFSIILYFSLLKENLEITHCKNILKENLEKMKYISCQMNDMDLEQIHTVDLSCIKEIEYTEEKSGEETIIQLKISFKNSKQIYYYDLFCPYGYFGYVNFDFSAKGQEKKLTVKEKYYSFRIETKKVYLCEGDEDSCDCCSDCSCKTPVSCNACLENNRNNCYFNAFMGSKCTKFPSSFEDNIYKTDIICNTDEDCSILSEIACGKDKKDIIFSVCFNGKCQYSCSNCESIDYSYFSDIFYCARNKCGIDLDTCCNIISCERIDLENFCKNIVTCEEYYYKEKCLNKCEKSCSSYSTLTCVSYPGI